MQEIFCCDHIKHTGCSKKFISFHKLISKRIPVQISAHFDSMFINSSKFDVFISYRYRDAYHWKRKSTLCVGSQNKTVQHVFMSELSKSLLTAMQIWSWHKKSKKKAVCAGEKDLDDQKHQKRRSSVFVKKSCKAQSNRYGEQVWNPRFHQ